MTNNKVIHYNETFYNMELDFILNLTEFKDQILDIGCGDKRFTQHINAIGMDCYLHYDVVDNRPDILASGTHLPFRGNIIESIHAHNVVEHIYEINKVIEECHRVLKQNGSMIIVSPHDFNWMIVRLFTLKIHDLLRNKGHFHKLNGKKILIYTDRLFYLDKIKFMPSRFFTLFTGVRLRKI